MTDPLHPDEFPGTDDGSHLVPKRLPELEHVGPLRSGSLRPFVGVGQVGAAGPREDAGYHLDHMRMPDAERAVESLLQPRGRVEFRVDDDAGASTLAGVMVALGFRPVRLLATAEHRDRWALGELLRWSKLSPAEHDLAAGMLGLKPMPNAPAYLYRRLSDKLGKPLEDAVAEIAEVRP